MNVKLKCSIQKLECKLSISLDAWTSSNGYAFIAIIAHYITNEGKLGKYIFEHSHPWSDKSSEEILIDFHELLGEHSGDNMADVVWGTLEKYGLIGRVNILF
jgi:hypothetical protein